MGRIIDFRISERRLSGLVINSDNTFFYNPHLLNDGDMFCDCVGFREGVPCSHILALLRRARFEGIDVERFISALLGEYTESDEEMIYETSIEGYNKLFGGLRGGRHVSCAFAEPEVGKSYLNATFMVDMALKHNASSLVIDTEGGFAPEWIELISEARGEKVNVEFIDWRVRVDVTNTSGKTPSISHKPIFDYKKLKITKPDKPTVYIYDARNIVQILPFFGRPISFKIKTGVIEPIEHAGTTSIWESPIGRIVETCGIKYVANDSLSAPLESFFTGGQINYRTRTKATQVWLGRAQDLIDEYKVVFMNTVHATINHSNPYAVPEPVGGKAVLHNNKYIAFIEKYESKKVAKDADVEWRNLRKMSIYRHMTEGAWSGDCYLLTTDHGVIDFDREQYIN